MTAPDPGSRPETHTITPHIVVQDATRAAEWYAQVFAASERGRLAVPDGRLMQVELWFGDSAVMLADEFPEMGVISPLRVGGTATVLHFKADDATKTWERAVAAGAEVRQPLQEAFWGELYGQITDPFGHRWGIAQHLREVPPEELERAIADAFGG
jgi:PhnB protein